MINLWMLLNLIFWGKVSYAAVSSHHDLHQFYNTFLQNIVNDVKALNGNKSLNYIYAFLINEKTNFLFTRSHEADLNTNLMTGIFTDTVRKTLKLSHTFF
ncbi:MAG: hypothetical protein HON94_01535 [Methylococcales bacterium]|nr:hypothetical protein [Methylococcales bacterium]